MWSLVTVDNSRESFGNWIWKEPRDFPVNPLAFLPLRFGLRILEFHLGGHISQVEAARGAGGGQEVGIGV